MLTRNENPVKPAISSQPAKASLNTESLLDLLLNLEPKYRQRHGAIEDHLAIGVINPHGVAHLFAHTF